MNTPTTAQKNRLARLLAGYILTDGTHIRTQQRAYDRYMRYFEDLERRYPRVAFRSEESQAALVSRAKAVAARKLFRGPGASC